jgi:soluble lytic murein transglycosylase
MPGTGDGIASALDVVGFTPGDLLRPAVSLRFGAYYLGGQMKRFSDPLLALAAYNAGPGNAQRWAAAANGATGADLLEVVDIGETNSYVQYVLEHYAHYEAAYR